MTYLVIGGSGLVGQNVLRECRRRDISAIGTSRQSSDSVSRVLDKTVESDVRSLIKDIKPDVVIDTAAFHDVDACESERDRAWSVNAQGTRNVAAAADTVNAHVIFLSTDYVFPGDPQEAPYVESNPINPINYYAQTKYTGEQATKISDDWTVLRTSVVYGLASPNFVTWALSELRAGNDIGIVDDQISTPTYAPDLARACIDVASDECTGIYHAAGPEPLSRYDFTRQLADVYGYNPELVEPITTEELGQEAPRPADGTLDSTALYDLIDYKFHSPKEAFEVMREESAD